MGTTLRWQCQNICQTSKKTAFTVCSLSAMENKCFFFFFYQQQRQRAPSSNTSHGMRYTEKNKMLRFWIPSSKLSKATFFMISRAIRVGGVYPMTKFTSMEVSRVPRLVLATSPYFLCGCIMLIRISQNKKKSGKRTSCAQKERNTKTSKSSRRNEDFQKFVLVTRSLKEGLWVWLLDYNAPRMFSTQQ